MALNDTFTDTDGTLLTAHTSDSGHGWVLPSTLAGQFTITSNSARCSTNNIVCSDWTPVSDDYDIIYTMEEANPAQALGIVFRFDPAVGSGYRLFHQWNANTIHFRRYDTGTSTSDLVTGTYDLTPAGGTASATLRLEVRGDTFTLYEDATDTQILTHTDATYGDAGSIGLYGFNAGTDNRRFLEISTVDVIPNTAPTVDAGADATITAGDTLSRTVSFTDPDADTWSATADYGEGAGAEAATVDQGAKTVALSNVYETEGAYTVTVVVSDGEDTGQDTFALTVNAAPVAGSYIAGTVTGTDASAPTVTFTP